MEGRTESVFSAVKLPPAFFQDLLLSYNVSSVVDMTPGQGCLLQTCLDLRIPVLAICLSDSHCEQLEERLTTYCMTKFVESGHTLYRAEAAKFITSTGEWKEEQDAEASVSEAKPRGGNGKKSPKKKKTKNDGDDSQEESESPVDKKNKKKKKRKNSTEDSKSEEEDGKKKKGKKPKKTSSEDQW